MKSKHIATVAAGLFVLLTGLVIFTIAVTPCPKPTPDEIRLCDLAVEKIVHDGMVTENIKNWSTENAQKIRATGTYSCNVHFASGAWAILMEGIPSSGWSSWFSNDSFDEQGYNVKYATQRLLSQADRPIRIIRSKRIIPGKDATVELIVASDKD